MIIAHSGKNLWNKDTMRILTTVNSGVSKPGGAMSFGKNSINNLEKRRPVFLKIGYVVTLAIVLAAFEWRTPVKMDNCCTNWEDFDKSIDEIIPITTPRKELSHQKITTKNPPVITTQTVITIDDQTIMQNPEPTHNEDDVPDFGQLAGPGEKTDTIPEWHPFPQFRASFPGGESEMALYLQNNIKFTPEAIEFREEGIVYVEFIVTKEGFIKEAKIKKGLGFGLNEVALRAVNNMPKWDPARQGIYPVSSPFVLPVRFTLKN